jgi:hypothetical protein
MSVGGGDVQILIGAIRLFAFFDDSHIAYDTDPVNKVESRNRLPARGKQATEFQILYNFPGIIGDADDCVDGGLIYPLLQLEVDCRILQV